MESLPLFTVVDFENKDDTLTLSEYLTAIIP
jgi:hypothetical protein